MLFAAPAAHATATEREGNTLLIDDFTAEDGASALGTSWRGVTDQVMGGVTSMQLGLSTVEGRPCLRMTGTVRLDNNGGFLQAALDLADGETPFVDASTFDGVHLDVRGNGERYSVHLRTPDNVRPWTSYRAHFTATPALRTVTLPFASFEAHRLDAPLDTSRLRRIGLVAIGRAFDADVCIARVAFYSDAPP